MVDIGEAMRAVAVAVSQVALQPPDQVQQQAVARRRRVRVLGVTSVLAVTATLAISVALRAEDPISVDPQADRPAGQVANDPTPTSAPAERLSVDPHRVIGGDELNALGRVWKIEESRPGFNDITNISPCDTRPSPMEISSGDAFTKVSRETHRGNGYVVSTVAKYGDVEEAEHVIDALDSAFRRCPRNGDASFLITYEVTRPASAALNVDVVGTDSGGVVSRRMFLFYRAAGSHLMAFSYSESEVLRADRNLAVALADRQLHKIGARVGR